MPTTQQYRTPGVYVTELNAFAPSVVGVQTAVPAFIGYTEKAAVGVKDVYFQPIKIRSLADYQAVFGGGFNGIFRLQEVGSPRGALADDRDFQIGGNSYHLTQTSDSRFYLYNSLRLFYANGGGDCFITSVGNYTDNDTVAGGVPVEYQALLRGLTATKDQVGPTVLMSPDALLLPADPPAPTDAHVDLAASPPDGFPTSTQFNDLVKAMMAQSAELKDRVALLDVYGAELLRPTSPLLSADIVEVVDNFRTGVGTQNLSYGMSYIPFLNTTIVQPSEILFTNFDIDDATQLATLQTALTNESNILYANNPVRRRNVNDMIKEIAPGLPDAKVIELNQNLVAALPVLGQMYAVIAGLQNILPPSGAMAGVFTTSDQTRGVWNAPANISLSSVISPTISITNKQQEELNVPLDGKSVNAIRPFVGRGTLVWGARTLDGNSNDWRYVQVRRAIVYIETSIAAALDRFVFAPNDAKTWAAVSSMVSSFLQSVWSQGGLMGAKASEAFSVQVGLGSTMTGQDILDGNMIVQVTLQMIRPAEFIELQFKQKMQGVS